MKPQQIILFLMVCLTAATGIADPMQYPYWQMINDVINNIGARPPRPVSMTENLRAADLEYPFEMFRHLRVTDLLRAASEGAQEARQQEALGKTEAEVEALVLQNVIMALEYLPMLIRNAKDVEEIGTLIANRSEDNVLRQYLLKNTSTGFAPQSLLSLSLPEIIDEYDEDFSKWVLRAATHPAEDPLTQNIALQVYYARLRKEYDLIVVDAPESEVMFGSVAPSRAREMVQHAETAEALKWSFLMRMIRTRFYDFASSIAGHIAEGSVRDDQVKQTTRRLLEDMRDNISGINEEMINTYLEGKPLRSEPLPELPQSPQSPASFPESATGSTAEPVRLDEMFEQMGNPEFQPVMR